MYEPITDKRVVVYDLETQNTFEDVGGRGNTEKLLISVAGVWDYADKRAHAYYENKLSEWQPLLKQAELIVGFNSKHFDHVVLKKYFPDFDIYRIKHLDLLESVQQRLGFRLKLETLARATLLEGKSGSGLDAIEYWKTKDFASLEKYCLDDVKITRDVLEYGARHGEVWYSEGDMLRPVRVDWDEWIPGYERDKTVRETITEAAQNGKQMTITYLISDEETGTVLRPEWTIDVLSQAEDDIRVFVHELHAEKQLRIPRVFSAKITGEADSFQAGLF